MSNRSGAGGYKGNIPAQGFVAYPGALNLDELNKPQDQAVYPGPDNQAPVLALANNNSLGRNQPFQQTTIFTNTGPDRGSFYWTGASGAYFTNPSVYTACPYGGGVGATKHRVNIDFGQTLTLNAVMLYAENDTGGAQPAVFGTTTSITSTTGTNLVNENIGTPVTQFRQKNFTDTASRYWFLECNFPGAGCGGCGSILQLFGVRTSGGVWLPINSVIPFVASKAYNNPLDSTPYYFIDGDTSTLNPDPWITRQTTSTIYVATRTPTGIDLNGNGIIQISGIASDPGKPYVGQTISGATSGATGRVQYVDSSTYYAYADIASGVAQSATIVYQPTSVASFTTGEKIYSIASSKPEPKLYYGSASFSSSAVLKIGSGLINGSGSLATIVNNQDWYASGPSAYYSAVSGTPANGATLLGAFGMGNGARVMSQNQVFYSASGTVLCSGLLYRDILFNTGSGYLDLDYQFTGDFTGYGLFTKGVITPTSGGWY